MAKQLTTLTFKIRLAIMTLMLVSLHIFCISQQLPDRTIAADRYYKNHDYAKAIPLYNSLMRQKVKLLYVVRLAESYRQIRDSKNAELWFEKQLGLAPESGLPRLYYAQALQENSKPEAALQVLKLFVPADKHFSDMKNLLINSCQKTISSVTEDPVFRIRNEKVLNTAYSDFGADISQNELVFVSNRPLSAVEITINREYKKLYGWTDKPFWKLFSTQTDSIKPGLHINLLSPVINSAFNNGPATFNRAGDVIYFSKAEVPDRKLFYKQDRKSNTTFNHNGIYISHKVGGIWGKAKGTTLNNTRRYSVSHPALAPDGKVLVFASDMPGGKGGVDLYTAKIFPDGNIGTPVNMGDSINSPGDEMFPTFGPDSSLYFSSTGWLGMGGLDIFNSKFVNGHWSGPENLAAPINSTKDDFSLIFKQGPSIQGYFSSNREGGMGDDDIYYFDYLPALAREKDSISQLNHLNISRLSAIDTVKTFFRIKRIDNLIGKVLILPQIHYRINKSNLDSVAMRIVYHVYQLLKLSPSMKVQINSYADITGNEKSNMLLSLKRANTIKVFLLSQGIPGYRLKTKGYGDHKPFSPCDPGKPCSVEQNRLNRRTELQILTN